MSTITTYPDATLASSNATVTGAATAHAALSDSSDSSYVDIESYIDGSYVIQPASVKVGVAEAALPTGALVTGAALNVRYKRVTGNTSATATVYLDGDGGSLSDTEIVTPGSTVRSEQVATVATATNPTDLVALLSTYSTTAYGGGGDAPASGTYGKIRLYETWVVTSFATKPTLTVTGPPALTTDSNYPSVTWTPSLDSSGGPQTRYEVRIFTHAQTSAGGFSPGTSTAYVESGITNGSATSWAPTAALADGLYTAYVRIGQTINGTAHLSDWTAGSEFEVDVLVPDTPTITVTPDNGNARIKIEVTHQSLGGATSDYVQVERSSDGGTTWEYVRTTDYAYGVTTGQDAVLYDYEAGNGVSVIYRARGIHQYPTALAYGAWATASATSWSGTTWWIKDPLNPANNLEVYVHSQADRTRAARQGVFQPLGATYASVVSDTRGTPTGTIVLRLATTEEQDALDALIDAGNPLLIQAPATDFWPDRYVSFSDQARARIADKAFVECVFDTLGWVQVASPAGVVVGFPDSLLPSTALYPSTTTYPEL